MDLYFSDVRSRETIQVLAAGDACRWMMDRQTLPLLPPLPPTHTLAVESEALRAYQTLQPFRWTEYCAGLPGILSTRKIQFALLPEVLDHPHETHWCIPRRVLSLLGE